MPAIIKRDVPQPTDPAGAVVGRSPRHPLGSDTRWEVLDEAMLPVALTNGLVKRD